MWEVRPCVQCNACMIFIPLRSKVGWDNPWQQPCSRPHKSTLYFAVGWVSQVILHYPNTLACEVIETAAILLVALSTSEAGTSTSLLRKKKIEEIAVPFRTQMLHDCTRAQWWRVPLKVRHRYQPLSPWKISLSHLHYHHLLANEHPRRPDVLHGASGHPRHQVFLILTTPFFP